MDDAISGAATRSCGNTSAAIWSLRRCKRHRGCPYGNEGMTDCAVLLEAAYEDTIEKLLALKETLEG